MGRVIKPYSRLPGGTKPSHRVPEARQPTWRREGRRAGVRRPTGALSGRRRTSDAWGHSHASTGSRRPAPGIVAPRKPGSFSTPSSLRRASPSDKISKALQTRKRAASSGGRVEALFSGRRNQREIGIPPIRVSSANDRASAKVRVFSDTRDHRSESISPLWYAMGVTRRSALSWRRSSRCSARLVNIRYGSDVPCVTRSSINTPM